MFNVKMLVDSLAPCEKRLISIECTYWRWIHSEILTHRDRARNSGSSRAIPWPTMCERIENDPALPIFYGKEQKGMQTGEQLSPEEVAECKKIILDLRDYAIKGVKKLNQIGLHKSICNRYTEPWMWITVIMSATEWKNFFRLRIHKDAEPHFNYLATEMKKVIDASTPRILKEGQWHLPFIDWESQEDGLVYCLNENDDRQDNDSKTIALDEMTACKISSARCARVSYVQHGEKKRKISLDLGLFDRLMEGSGFGHVSPYEHSGRAESEKVRSGPFIGFTQFRKLFPNENLEG